MKLLLLAFLAIGLLGFLGLAQDEADHEFGHIVNDGYGDFAFVPAGEFLMGDNYEEGNPRERPAHPVYLDSYYIGVYEVANEEYKGFIDDGGYANREYWSTGGFGIFSEPRYWNDATFRGGGLPGNGRFPVCGVSWYEANAYCAWLSAKTGQVCRLPTEAEWEKAARGGHFLDGDATARVPNPIDPPRRYPWGQEIDGSYANYLDSGDPFDNGLTPIGYYDGTTHDGFATHSNESPYGVFDMSGNVYEWCRDGYGEAYYRECFEAVTVENPTGPAFSRGYVIRGSAFDYETFKQRCAYRGSYYPTARMSYIGIRVVREVSAEPQ